MKSLAPSTRSRGKPLLMLGFVLIAYGGLRAAMWELPFAQAPRLVAQSAEPRVGASRQFSAETGLEPKDSIKAASMVGHIYDRPNGSSQFGGAIIPHAPGLQNMMPTQVDIPTQRQHIKLQEVRSATDVMQGGSTDIGWLSSAAIPGNNLLPPTKATNRWSADAWAFYRPDAAQTLGNGARPTTYGGSQGGAVLRYRLRPGSGHIPALYVRATHGFVQAGGGNAETEIAAGLSVRPVRSLPVAAYGEIRARDQNGRREIRPAAFIVTELQPIPLPLAGEAETYLQAGYVGGDFATPFADGQAVVSRQVANTPVGQLRAGAGLWGGAQRGAARLDVGPSAGLRFKIGKVNARAQVDYRLRVAGDATPGDGVALTLATGF